MATWMQRSKLHFLVLTILIFLYPLFTDNLDYKINSNYAIALNNPTITKNFSDVNPNQEYLQNLTILHFNDWHGNIEPHDGYGGASQYLDNFKQEGHIPGVNDSVLLMSAGDHNAGSALTTMSEGDVMIDIMNVMGVDASTIGNHEFDFGIEVLEKQANDSNFPWICSNVIDLRTNQIPKNVIPYLVADYGGIKVGIIGLVTTYSTTSLHPKITQYLEFLPYEETIRKYISNITNEGAEVIIALTHIPPSQLIPLVEAVSDLNIDVFIGGHNEGAFNDFVGNSLVISAEHRGFQYSRIDITYDYFLNDVTVITAELNENPETTLTPDPNIQNVIEYWRNIINPDQAISFTSVDIEDNWPDSGIGDLVTDSFIDYFNWTHSFSVGGRGSRAYFWDKIYAGEVSLEDVVNVAKREFYLIQVTMTGIEIKDMISSNHEIFTYSGIRYNYSTNPDLILNEILILTNGEYKPLDPQMEYTGLMLDLFWWSSYFGLFEGVETGVHQRDAVFKYFSKLNDLSQHTLDGRVGIFNSTTVTSQTNIVITSNFSSSNEEIELSGIQWTSFPLFSTFVFIIFCSSLLRRKQLLKRRYLDI